MKLKIPFLKILVNACVTAPQEKTLEIKRDEWLLMRCKGSKMFS